MVVQVASSVALENLPEPTDRDTTPLSLTLDVSYLSWLFGPERLIICGTAPAAICHSCSLHSSGQLHSDTSSSQVFHSSLHLISQAFLEGSDTGDAIKNHPFHLMPAGENKKSRRGKKTCNLHLSAEAKHGEINSTALLLKSDKWSLDVDWEVLIGPDGVLALGEPRCYWTKVWDKHVHMKHCRY